MASFIGYGTALDDLGHDERRHLNRPECLPLAKAMFDCCTSILEDALGRRGVPRPFSRRAQNG